MTKIVVRSVLVLVLAGFAVMTLRVLTEQSYAEFLETATANAATGLLFMDLVICLALAGVWMVRDARSRGIAAWPFLALAATFGAAGPLLYLIRRPGTPVAPAAAERLLPRTLLVAVLALFGAATLYALSRHGYLALLLYASANPASQLLIVDLAICLVLAAVWMLRDARSRDASAAPFLPLVLLYGSLGTLLHLLTRELGRSRQRLVGAAALALAALVLPLGTGHADLRSEAVRRPDPGAARRGRERLEKLAERHGLSAWRRHTTLETRATDYWPGGGPWWPEADQRFETQALLGSFTSRAELLDGRGRGEVWGLQAWAAYKQRPGDAGPGFLSEPDRAISFYLPALQYFNELPFRLLAAPVVSDAGERRYRGRSYDRVFVTWGGPEPRAAHDQYLLWIDRETGLLSMVRYTVRDGLVGLAPGQVRMLRSLLMGTMHYQDYREVDGVMLPFLQTVVLPPPELTRYPLKQHFFHRLELEHARFDALPREALLPDPSRGEPGDRKPEAVATGP